MNLIREINERNEKELALGLTTTASWHDKYKESAYIYVGGIDYDLTEGDLIRVFSQYGEIVDINLVRDENTGETKGFCYIAYEDQRSTNLAVDNFNGIKLGDRIISVDHKLDYFRKVKTNGESEDSIPVEKPLLLRQLQGEIPTEQELEEKRKRKEEKRLKKEEKRRIKEEKKRKREIEKEEEENKKRKEEIPIAVGPVGPQKPKSNEVKVKIETEEEIEQRLKDEARREKYYSKEFFFDQNINVNPENITNRQHYEQSYLYGLNQPHKLAPTDSRFGYDHLRYYDSLTNKDREHKEKKMKHKEKILYPEDYVDGGAVYLTPISSALKKCEELGYDEMEIDAILAIGDTSLPGWVDRLLSTPFILLRTIFVTIANIFVKDIENAQHSFPHAKIRVIEPSTWLPGYFIGFGHTKEMISIGYKDVMKTINKKY